MAKHNAWTSKMDEHLSKLYPVMPASDIADILKVSKQAVLRRARKLEIPSKADTDNASIKRYTILDDEFIRKNVAVHGVRYCAKSLHRSDAAIRSRAKRLGVSISIKPHWSTEQINFLRKNIDHLTYQQIGINVGKSCEAVRKFAYSKGIKRKPRGTVK